MFRVPINPGDLLLTKDLQLVVVDIDHDNGYLSGRRLNDGRVVEVREADVIAVYPGSRIAPKEPANA